MGRAEHTEQHGRVLENSDDPVAAPTGLPTFRGALVGRDSEVRRLSDGLAKHRIVTLAGPGGIGKTRLAAETAHAAGAEFPDGVVWVDLVPIRDPGLAVSAVATAVGAEEEAGRPLLDTLAGNLRYQRLLLFLDNCEHVLDAVRGLVSRLLDDCPDVTVVCTSRQHLGLPGEERVEVAALPTRGDGGPETAPAVQLFVVRASEAQTDFRLTDENVTAVSEVCRRLDGVPLAIELAAARMSVLGLADLADRLDRLLDLPRAGDRPTARHQTLRAVFDWSYGLLDEAEQRLFDRLGPFAGGFTIDAAEGVCSGGPLERAEILEVLGSLIDKSLVSVSQRGDRARFHRMDTLRIYATERLASSGEEVAVRRRHAEWFRDLARRSTLRGRRDVAGLEVETDNFRSALSWSLEHDTLLAAELVASLAPFWKSAGHLAEGRQWAERVLEAAANLAAQPMAALLEGVGTLAAAQADYTAARAYFDAARSLLGDEDPMALARVETELGVIARYEGRLDEAEALLFGALDRQRTASDRRSASATLVELGHVAALRTDGDTARLLYGQAVSLSGQAGDEAGVARATVLLGELAARANEVALARLHYDEAGSTFERLGDRRGLAAVLTALGRLSVLKDEVEVGRSYHQRALALYEEVGDRRGQGNALAGLAFLAYMVGDHVGSEALFRRAVAVRRSMGDRRGMAVAMVGVANATFLRISPPPDLETAKKLCEEALAVQLEISDERNAAWTTYSLAEITRDMGLHEESRSYAEASIDYYAATRQGIYNGVAHASLAAVTVADGDPDGAAPIAAEALNLARRVGVGLQIIRCVELTARVCAARGQLAPAAQLYAAADVARRAVTPRLPERVGQQRVLDADLALIGERLSPEELAAARAAGEVMSVDEAADMAALMCRPAAAERAGGQADAVAAATVQVLGRFAIPGVGVPTAGGAPAQLVKLVAVAGPIHRDEVVEHLWANAGPGVGRRRLHNVLTRVRKAFGEVIVREGDTLSIRPGVTTDLALFTAAAKRALALSDAGSDAAQAELETALGLYGGELLPDDRYEDWTTSPRERTSQLVLRLLHAGAQLREARGDVAGAVQLLEKAIDTDRIEEDNYVTAARLLMRAGWRDRAREMVRRAESVAAELGLAESDRLRQIKRDLAPDK